MTTLRQLQAEATPGPWETDGPHHVFAPQDYDVLVTHHDENDDRLRYTYICTDSTEADARLIAAAPTHLADLITALEREQRIREVHKPFECRGGCCIECIHCKNEYPCPTIRILDGNE